MMQILVLLVFVAGCSAVNRTVVFGNSYYYGHYLYTNGSATSFFLFFHNPPITNNHRWVIDWDTIFVSNSSITWKGDATNAVINVQSSADNMAVKMGALRLLRNQTAGANHVWKLKYRTSGSTTLYMIESVSTPGCITDENLQAQLTGIGNCTESNPKAWWNIYLA